MTMNNASFGSWPPGGRASSALGTVLRCALVIGILALGSAPARAQDVDLPSPADIAALQATFPLSLADVPDHVEAAFLAAEGHDFWSRAREGRPTLIARQVVGQLLRASGQDPTHAWGGEERKMVGDLTRALPPEEILTIYLNLVFLGRDATGLAAASQAYFGKPVSELGVSDAAYLAMLVKAPLRYDDPDNAQDALERREYVLKRMAEAGTISDAQLAEALAAPLP